MKIWISSLVVIFSLSGAGAHAEKVFGTYSSPHSWSVAFGFMNPGNNVMSGSQNGTDKAVSFHLSGFLGLGGDYDYMAGNDLSYGGILRYYSTSASVAGNSIKNSMLALGPDFKGYFSTENWGCYFGAGLALMMPTYSDNAGSVTINNGIGVTMAIGFLHKFSDKMSIGFETLRMMGLSGPIYGTPIEDYMAKIRVQM